MFDHLTDAVSDLARSHAFYESVDAAGYAIQHEFSDDKTGHLVAVGDGMPGKPAFWLIAGTPPLSMHIAFASTQRAAVDAFHPAVLAAGGRDNGAPGLRPTYHADSCAAFVFDPDGYNIEAACHTPGA